MNGENINNIFNGSMKETVVRENLKGRINPDEFYTRFDGPDPRVAIRPVVGPKPQSVNEKSGIEISPVEDRVKAAVQPPENLRVKPIEKQNPGGDYTRPVEGPVTDNVGSPSTGNVTSIIMSTEELEANSRVLREASESIRKSWDDILNTQINNLQNSWAGPDAKMYIEKVTPFNEKIKATSESVDLLASSFDQARKQLQDTQNDLAKQISSM